MSSVKAELTKKSIRITDGGHSYKMKPKTINIGASIKLDEFKHAQISAVAYKILVETKIGQKEIFDIHVLADKDNATILKYGHLKISTNSNMVEINLSVNLTKVVLNATSIHNEILKIVAIPTYFEAIV